MSYSVDVNVLLYATDLSSPYYRRARAFLVGRARDPDVFCIAWMTVMSFLRISTHSRIFDTPLTPSEALQNVEALLTLPRCRTINEGERFLDVYREVTGDAPVRGNLVPDSHLAAVLRENDVRILYTADGDFRRFPFLDVRNPVAAPPDAG